MPNIVCDGDTSSHGGTVKATATKTLVSGRMVVRAGDPFSCPLKNHNVTPVLPGTCSKKLVVEGSPVAVTGTTTGCGAVLIGTGKATSI
jgi:uncharacterized Zn-binding protein involved in type VI secretion